MKEIWKPLAQCDKYECSNFGHIRNRETQKIVNGSVNNKGYVRFDLCKDGKRFVVSGHRAVAETFLRNEEEKPHINHIDGIKTNNCITNLEWCTAKENTVHARDVLKYEFGKNKRKIVCVETNTVYNSVLEAANLLQIRDSDIHHVLKRRRKHTHNLHFQYV